MPKGAVTSLARVRWRLLTLRQPTISQPLVVHSEDLLVQVSASIRFPYLDERDQAVAPTIFTVPISDEI